MTHSADAAVGEAIHRILWRRKIRQQDAAAAIGISAEMFSRKIHGLNRWWVDEVMATAAYLGVPPADLMPDLDEWCAARDSDPQPADWEFAQVIPLRRSDVGHIVRRVA